MQQGEVFFGLDAYRILDQYLDENSFSKIFILTDSNTLQYCLMPFLEKLNNLKEYELLEIEPGEENKNIETVVSLWDGLTELGADRNSLIINLGGGVLTDMGGFVASTFKRGFKFINVPTTLLSMVDASTGGKTGIDLGDLKNQIGAFSLPEMVVVSSEYLSTLDQRQLRSGLAEMFKHGLIADRDHWFTLISMEDLDASMLDNLIKQSVKVKIKVVEQDPTEKGLRKILNFGHTIGHAVETFFMNTDNMLFHGEAIAVGMISEAYLSTLYSDLSIEDANSIKDNILEYFPKISIQEDEFSDIITLMIHDKKNTEGKINFSLLKEIGDSIYDTVIEKDKIKEALRFYLN